MVSTCASERDARTNEQRKSIARSSEDGKDTGGENGGGGDAVVKDEPREEDADADADDAEGVVNVPRRARTGAWSRRVAFFSFDSRRVIFFQSARAVRAVVRASDGFPGARGWMVGLFHQPNQNRVESSCHPHHPSRSWNLDRFDSRRSTGRRRERPSRAEIDWKVTIAIAPGSIGRFRVATASVVRLFRNRSRPSRAAKKRFRRTNETKRNSFTDAKRCARAREN